MRYHLIDLCRIHAAFLGLLHMGVLSAMAEVQYNGIRLPETWPPENINPASPEPMPVPYLENPPKVIPIDRGRQLLVDDFLVEETTLKMEFHHAKKYEGNPVFKAETPMEQYRGMPVATPKSGGVWWDPRDSLYKMWYEAGWLGTMAYATSPDGVHWDRPPIQNGGNALLLSLRPDSTAIVLDHFAENPSERFKLFLRGPGGGLRHGYSMTSPDGISWNPPVTTGKLGDRSTFFYNPFRKKWVYSIRASGHLSDPVDGRARYYREHDDFIEGAQWKSEDLVFWAKADRLDPPDPEIGDPAELYNLDAVAYESLMLGLYQIHRGPSNSVVVKQGVPKITELNLAYSRDGFHWHRPDRDAFIPATRRPGDWDRGYVQSVGGVCLIVGDELRFYYTGFKGDPEKSLKGDPENRNPYWMENGMYAGGSTGIAKIRRDGFVSRNANMQGGTLTTRPLTFSGKYLFVNVDNPQGSIRAEILDRDGHVIAPFTLENSRPLSVDSTAAHLHWKGGDHLSSLHGKPVRFRFHLENGKLYSFWVSPDKSGASHGYVAAGGPGFTGPTDTVGQKGPRQFQSSGPP